MATRQPPPDRDVPEGFLAGASPVVESPEEEPARFFELDPDFPPAVTCPDCHEELDLFALVRRDGNGVEFSMGALTLGAAVDAANQHECSEEDR